MDRASVAAVHGCLHQGSSADFEKANYDEFDEADDETQTHLDKEYAQAETKDEEPYGKPGSLLNKLIMHGNKKTEDEIARGSAQTSEQTNTKAS